MPLSDRSKIGAADIMPGESQPTNFLSKFEVRRPWTLVGLRAPKFARLMSEYLGARLTTDRRFTPLAVSEHFGMDVHGLEHSLQASHRLALKDLTSRDACCEYS